MQREKLYNLHKIAYFIVALSVFKMDKSSSDHFRQRENDILFGYKMNSFFSHSYFYNLFFLNGRVFLAASCGVFYFFLQNITGSKMK